MNTVHPSILCAAAWSAAFNGSPFSVASHTALVKCQNASADYKSKASD